MTTYIYTVNNIVDREKLISTIYDKLTLEPSVVFKVQRSGVNGVIISHYNTPIRKYLVIVLPVTINLEQIKQIQGNVIYNLDETILSLQKLLERLQHMQGRRFVKGSSDGKSLSKELQGLVR